MLTFFLVYIVALLLIAIVLGPIFGAEDRPGFLNVNEKPRSNV